MYGRCTLSPSINLSLEGSNNIPGLILQRDSPTLNKLYYKEINGVTKTKKG